MLTASCISVLSCRVYAVPQYRQALGLHLRQAHASLSCWKHCTNACQPIEDSISLGLHLAGIGRRRQVQHCILHEELCRAGHVDVIMVHAQYGRMCRHKLLHAFNAKAHLFCRCAGLTCPSGQLPGCRGTLRTTLYWWQSLAGWYAHLCAGDCCHVCDVMKTDNASGCEET